MKKYLLAIIAGLILVSEQAFAQEKELNIADNTFQNGKYTDAIELYKKAYVAYEDRKKNKGMKSSEIKITKAQILFQIGECYRMLNDNKQEVQWYQKAMKAHCSDSVNAAKYYNSAQRFLDSVRLKNPEPELQNYKQYKSQIDTTKNVK